MADYSTPIKAKMANTQAGTSSYRLFPQDYFSGCDIAIYFGDTFIDEITSLQFILQENVLPLYGYSDYRYRELVHGNRIVTGAFSINFKESAYIYAVIERMKRAKEGKVAGAGTASLYGEGISPYGQEWNKKDVEQLYKEWLDNAKLQNPTGNMDTFETIADYYERALWGSPDTTYSIGYGKNKLEMDFASMIRNRRTSPFFDTSFTITITYGNVEGAFASRDNGTYQDILNDKSYRPGSLLLPVEETIKTIVDVHLTGVSQSQDMSGNPVQEVYQFMAKDIDNFDDAMVQGGI